MILDPDRWHPPVAIAHRGSRTLWPENTMLAFGEAVALGFRHIETDLRLTADDVLVCFHDSTVDRTTDGAGPIAERTLADLVLLDAGFRHRANDDFPFRGVGAMVPTFEELATTFPNISLIVDLKADGLAAPLAALIDDRGLHERLIVGSFSDARIAEFRELTDGRVATSSGPFLSRMWVLASRVGRGASGDASALQVPTHMRGVKVVDKKLIDAAHQSGLQVHVWTVNTKADMEDLLDMGVDGLVTDRADILKDVLESRGEWNP